MTSRRQHALLVVVTSRRRHAVLIGAALLVPVLAACSSHSRTAAPATRATTSAPAATTPTARTTTPPRSPVPAAVTTLAGRVIVLDPGHNPNDLQHLAQIDALVDVITERKPCDAIGTSTDAGYPESRFTYDVALRAAAILRARGATVILTRTPSTPYGPCINQRAAIGNEAHADASVAIHADGGPAGGTGFQVILPGPVGPNDGMIARSDRLGTALHAAFHTDTGEPYADYLGGGTGYTTRTDLGGLNLSTVPKVFIECANMRNAVDAARVTSSAWRERAALGVADGITAYLTG